MADVLKATYADLKTVKTRSTCQLILELPIEALTDVVALLGAPVPGNEVWVAVARLREGTEAKPQEALPAPKKISLAQLAGILCNEPAFEKYAQTMGYDDPVDFVRHECGVESRAHIIENTPAGVLFRDLKASYEAWMRT